MMGEFLQILSLERAQWEHGLVCFGSLSFPQCSKVPATQYRLGRHLLTETIHRSTLNTS